METELRFSQRIGVTPVSQIVQKNRMDDALSNSLWSLLTLNYWHKFDRNKFSVKGSRSDTILGSNLGTLFTAIWMDYFKSPIDTIPHLFYDDGNGLSRLRNYYFNSNWYQKYEFIEFIAANGPPEYKSKFISQCNDVLEKENSAFRFVDGVLVEISSSEEIREIELAISQSSPFFGVKQHLSAAILLLSDKENPDFRNSIKESISAIESLCKTVSNQEKATLGAALKVLESRGTLHSALKSAFSSLYGYTNDADGIRHALMEESNLTSADARFMLIICSSFINYVIAVNSGNSVSP